MANVRIPVEIGRSGKFTLMNKYTKIEITDLDFLPPEGEESLNDKITEYLALKREKEESEMREAQAKIDEIRRQQMENERIQKEEFENYKRDKEEFEKMKLAELEKIKKEKEDFKKYKVEQIETEEKFLKISKNDIKMRKHTGVVSFKNLKGFGSGSYTRKAYS